MVILCLSFSCVKIGTSLCGSPVAGGAAIFVKPSNLLGALFGYMVSMPHDNIFVKWQNETTLKIYNSFTMEIFTTEKQERSLVGLRLNKKLLEKFRDLGKAERRDYNAQMELMGASLCKFKSPPRARWT